MGAIKVKAGSQYISVISGSRYVTRSVTYSKIPTETILEYAAENSNINAGAMAHAFKAIVQTFTNFLLNGHSCQLGDIGTFRFSVNATATEDEGDAGASAVYRKKIIYTPSTTLKSAIEDTSVTTQTSSSDEEDDEEEEDSEDSGDTAD